METSVRFEALTLTGATIGPIERIAGGSVTVDSSRSVEATGSITVPHDDGAVDWANILIQPWRTVDGTEWPIGAFVAVQSGHAWSGTGASADIQIMDRTWLLQRAIRGDSYALAAGAPVRDTVVSLIEWVGLAWHALPDAMGTVQTDVTWQPGTTVLAIINQLLSWHGWRRLACDGWGRFVVRPALGPTSTPVTAEFISGERFSYTPRWERAHDVSEIPNVVELTTQGSGDDPGLRVTAENWAANDPLSLANRPRVTFYDDVEAEDLVTLQAQADRVLAEKRMEEVMVTVSHPWRDLAVGDGVRFASAQAGIDSTFIVQRVSIPLDTLTLQQTMMSEVPR